ncbi:MAG: hypothetical protein ACD_69C00353G0001 [uncultured bacterium]|nr:MAG: hypothetical protein ACD_69C00353G0001 [uncultured bacterium]
MNIFIKIFLFGIVLNTTAEAVRLESSPKIQFGDDTDFFNPSVTKKLSIKFEDEDKDNESTIQAIENRSIELVEYIKQYHITQIYLKGGNGELKIQIDDIKTDDHIKLASVVLYKIKEAMSSTAPDGRIYMNGHYSEIFAKSFIGFFAHLSSSDNIRQRVDELNNEKNNFLRYYNFISSDDAIEEEHDSSDNE